MPRLFLILGLALLMAGCIHRAALYSYQSPYDEPMVSPGLKFLGLPAAVQNSIRAQSGAAEIEDIGRYDVHGGTYYKVWFTRGGSFPPLYIAPDGSILNSDLVISMAAPVETYEELAGHGKGTLKVADLPPEVVKTIQAQAKTLEIGRINATTTGDQTVYEVYFKSEGLPMLRIDQEGKVVESTSGMGRIRKPPSQ